MAVGTVGNLLLGSSLSLFPSLGEYIVGACSIGNTKEVRVRNFLTSGAAVAARVAERLFYEFQGESKRMNIPIVDESYARSPKTGWWILGNMIPGYDLICGREGREGLAKGSRLSRCIQYGLYHRSRFLCENPEGTVDKKGRSSSVPVLNRDRFDFLVPLLDTTLLAPYTKSPVYLPQGDMSEIKVSYQNYGYIRGAELGFPPAQFELGRIYEAGEKEYKDHHVKAQKWYSAAERQGYKEVQGK